MKKMWARNTSAQTGTNRADLKSFEETYHRGLRGDVYLNEFFTAVFQKSKSGNSVVGLKIKKTVIFRRLQHFFRDLAKRFGPAVSDCRSNSDIRIFGSGIKVMEFVELRECLFRTQDSLVKFAWWIVDRPTSDPRLHKNLTKTPVKRNLPEFGEVVQRPLKKEVLQDVRVKEEVFFSEGIPDLPESSQGCDNDSFVGLENIVEIDGVLGTPLNNMFSEIHEVGNKDEGQTKISSEEYFFDNFLTM